LPGILFAGFLNLLDTGISVFVMVAMSKLNILLRNQQACCCHQLPNKIACSAAAVPYPMFTPSCFWYALSVCKYQSKRKRGVRWLKQSLAGGQKASPARPWCRSAVCAILTRTGKREVERQAEAYGEVPHKTCPKPSPDESKRPT
jgi:hypothetical protein